MLPPGPGLGDGASPYRGPQAAGAIPITRQTDRAIISSSPVRMTHQTIFQHPASHNLDWRHVRVLFEHLAEVVEQPNGNLKVTRNGQVLVLHPPRTKDVAETDEIMALRHFLERSGTISPETGGKEAPWLPVIDHHEARLFRSEMPGAIPQQILPHIIRKRPGGSSARSSSMDTI